MMNESNGIEVDIDNYYMNDHGKRGWDDVHFADDEDISSPVSQTDCIGNVPEQRPLSRKKRAAIVLAAIVSFGAIIGLGYGIGYGIGGTIGNDTNNVMSSNMNAVTLEDCMDYYSSSSSINIPTYSPTTYYPTSSPLSEEERMVAMFFPVFSNDIPIITDDDELVTTQVERDGEENGNDNDGPVRRLGSPITTIAMTTTEQSAGLTSLSSQDAVEQRKLACDKLVRN